MQPGRKSVRKTVQKPLTMLLYEEHVRIVSPRRNSEGAPPGQELY